MGLDVQHANILKELNKNFAETAHIQKLGDSPLMSDTLLSSIFQESQRDQKGSRPQFGFNNKENINWNTIFKLKFKILHFNSRQIIF